MLDEIDKISKKYIPYPKWPFVYEIYKGPTGNPKRRRQFTWVCLSKSEVYVDAYNYINDILKHIKLAVDDVRLSPATALRLKEKIAIYDQPKTETSDTNIYKILATDFYMIIHRQPKLKLNKTYKLMDTTVYSEPITLYVKKVHHTQQHQRENQDESVYINSNKHTISDQYKQWLSTKI